MGWLLALALGCSGPSAVEDCAPLSAVAVVDADGLATPEVRGFVDEALNDMARWMGDDAVCVDRIHLVGGRSRTRGPDVYIDVTADEGPDAAGHRVFDQLCAAFDDRWDLSGRFPELFGDEDNAFAAFVQACAKGPRDPGLLLALEDLCGEDLLARRQVLLNEVVFSQAELLPWPAPGSIDLTLTRTPLHLSHGLGSYPVPVDGGLAFTTTEVVAVGDDWLREPRLGRIDAATGAVTYTVGPLLASGEPDVLASDGLALVVDADDARAWFVGDTWEEVPFPEIPGQGQVTGAVVGRVAWVERDGRLYRVDTTTGELTPTAEDQPVSFYNVAPRAGGGLVGAGWAYVGTRLWSDADRVWAEYDGAANAWTVEALPHPALNGPRLPLPDGRVVSSWTAAAPLRPYLSGVAVVDPETGEWWVDPATCGADGLAEPATLAVVDGAVWAVEDLNGWNGGPFLTRVEVPPR